MVNFGFFSIYFTNLKLLILKLIFHLYNTIRICRMCNAGVTLSNLLYIFFDSYSANTKKYQCYHLKNKFNHIKAQYFQLLSTHNLQHIILTQSKKLHENRCRSNDPPKINRKCAENESKGFAKRIFEISNQTFMFCLFLSFFLSLVYQTWSKIGGINFYPSKCFQHIKYGVNVEQIAQCHPSFSR